MMMKLVRGKGYFQVQIDPLARGVLSVERGAGDVVGQLGVVHFLGVLLLAEQSRWGATTSSVGIGYQRKKSPRLRLRQSESGGTSRSTQVPSRHSMRRATAAL